MQASTRLTTAVITGVVCAFTLSATTAHDNDDGGKIVTVGFGAGLNTAQPGNAQNHHVLPNVIKVEVGDVVNFVVAGLHVIRVFEKGVRLRDLKAEIPDECEVNPPPFPASCNAILIPNLPVPILTTEVDPVTSLPTTLGLPLYYNGLNSVTTPPFPPAPPFAPLSYAQNRVEPVSFLKPGRFLVICAVLPHLNDGMFAWVEVRNRGHHDDDDHRH
jgi:plastocyanin